MEENTVPKITAIHTDMNMIIAATCTTCNSNACKAWKETKRDCRLIRKITKGGTHPPKSWKTWAKMAMVFSSCVGSKLGGGGGVVIGVSPALRPSFPDHLPDAEVVSAPCRVEKANPGKRRSVVAQLLWRSVHLSVLWSRSLSGHAP